MWIYLNNAFVSIVRSKNDPKMLHVRARKRGDIERFFGKMLAGSRVIATAKNDYKFRADVPRETVAETISRHVMGITYPDFKRSVRDDRRHDVYLKTWTAAHGLEGR